ncbi:MAG: PTS sugar transporter subunit IIA [Akkermansiaceae bacterium]|nr:PTS sugar transporter subunit IIA [Akkermansiaceae bacterium]MCF7731110.1 PTS sugar transporter subunit IIA [Akkermansiaceae bacterium]
MRLTELLSPCQILLDLKAEERWLAIIELVDLLVKRGKLAVELQEDVLTALKTREDLVSTGVGYGVAIPHAFSDKLDRVVAVFGRSRKGIDFESLDGGLVKFVILFLVPQRNYAMHLHTLSAIAKLFTNSDVRHRLAAAEKRSEVLGILETKQSRSSNTALSRRLPINGS